MGWEAVVGSLGACVIRVDTDMVKRHSAALGSPCRCKVFPAFLAGLGKGSGRSVPSFPNGQYRLPKRSSNSLTLYTAERILNSPIRREGICHFCRSLAGQREPLCQSGQRQTGRHPEPERNRAHGKQKWRELGTFRKCAEQNFLMVLLQTLTPSVFSCLQIPSEKLALWGTPTYQVAVSPERRILRTNLFLRGLGVVQCSGA